MKFKNNHPKVQGDPKDGSIKDIDFRRCLYCYKHGHITETCEKFASLTYEKQFMYLHNKLKLSITTKSQYPLNYIKYLEGKFKHVEECYSNIFDVNITNLFADLKLEIENAIEELANYARRASFNQQVDEDGSGRETEEETETIYRSQQTESIEEPSITELQIAEFNPIEPQEEKQVDVAAEEVKAISPSRKRTMSESSRDCTQVDEHASRSRRDRLKVFNDEKVEEVQEEITEQQLTDEEPKRTASDDDFSCTTRRTSIEKTAVEENKEDAIQKEEIQHLVVPATVNENESVQDDVVVLTNEDIPQIPIEEAKVVIAVCSKKKKGIAAIFQNIKDKIMQIRLAVKPERDPDR